MGRLRRTAQHTPVVQQGPRPLLASAALVKQSQIRKVPTQQPWQTQAWDYYDTVGELRFAGQWLSNALSRCSLYIGIPDPDRGGIPDPIGQDNPEVDDAANVPLDELFGGASGHAEMLARLALHLTVPGESYLVGFDDPATSTRRWLVCATEEFARSTGDQFKIRMPETDEWLTLSTTSSTVIRMWRPHPRRNWEADSPVRAALPILKELVELSAHISATVESRLAGAGVLFIPESATLPSPNAQSPNGQLHEDPAMAALIDAMVTPIADRDSAAAVVPIMVRVPDAAANKPQYMTFSTPLDQQVQTLRESAIRRFATVVDMPAEVMSGAAQSTNHWGMWKVSEEAVTIHIAPLMSLICDALTRRYLWPALEALGNVANPRQYVIWYDANNLILRPNRGPEAQNLYPKGLIKSAVVRSANGFSEQDAPDAEERNRILLEDLMLKGIDPVLIEPYAAALGIDLDLENLRKAIGDFQLPGSRIRGRPSVHEKEQTRPDALPKTRPAEAVTASADGDGDDLAHAIAARVNELLDLAAIEMGAVRALELAGKRLLNGTNREWRGRLRGVEPWEIHTHILVTDPDDVLEGAFVLLDKCLPDVPCVRNVVDHYVRGRLAAQQPHNRSHLIAELEQSGCLWGDPRALGV